MRKRADYQRIQARSRRFTTPHFVFLLSARDDHGGARLGITVSRKVGTATVRNRAKRLIREAFRATRELWADDVDVIVIAKRSTGDAGLDQVVDEWCRAAPVAASRTADARRDRARQNEAAANG